MSEIEADGTQRPEPRQDLARVSPPGEPLSPFLVLFFYAQGVFPWMRNEGRRLWWSPQPRSVMAVRNLHISRSLRRTLRRGRYRVTADTAFREVVSLCRETRTGEGQGGSWITEEEIDVFTTLHRLGHAHSLETWEGDQLVGGLYGVCVGSMFFGCSMFHLRPDASKVAFVKLCQQLDRWEIPILDCQIQNPHLKRMGASLLPRQQFHETVGRLVRGTRRTGSWTQFFT